MRVREVNATETDAFHAWQPQLHSPFTTAEWCSIYDANRLKRFWLINDAEKICGGFVAYEGGNKFLKTLITPPLAQHIGLFLSDEGGSTYKQNAYLKKVATALSEFLKQSKYLVYKLELPHWFSDLQPFIWNEQSTSVRYTYRLDLTKSIEDIRSNFKPELRNTLAKSEKDGLERAINRHQEEIAEALQTHVRDKHLAISTAHVARLMEVSVKSANAFTVEVRSAESYDMLACNLCYCDADNTYFLMSALGKVRHNAANAAGIFEAIVHSKSIGMKYFDFEGSMIPDVESFFRSFGAELTPMYTVTGGKSVLPAVYHRWKNRT